MIFHREGGISPLNSLRKTIFSSVFRLLSYVKNLSLTGESVLGADPPPPPSSKNGRETNILNWTSKNLDTFYVYIKEYSDPINILIPICKRCLSQLHQTIHYFLFQSPFFHTGEIKKINHFHGKRGDGGGKKTHHHSKSPLGRFKHIPILWYAWPLVRRESLRIPFHSRIFSRRSSMSVGGGAWNLEYDRW